MTVSSGFFPNVFVDFSFQIFSFRCDLTHNDTISTNFPSGPPDETIGLIAKSLISVIILAAIWITRNTILTRAQRESNESNMSVWWSASADNPGKKQHYSWMSLSLRTTGTQITDSVWVKLSVQKCISKPWRRQRGKAIWFLILSNWAPKLKKIIRYCGCCCFGSSKIRFFISLCDIMIIFLIL